MIPWHLLVCTNSKTSLVDAAIKTTRGLAGAKPQRKLENGRHQAGRPKFNIDFARRNTPSFVNDLIEIQERSRPDAPQIEGLREINARAQKLLEDEELAGLTIFNDNRF